MGRDPWSKEDRHGCGHDDIMDSLNSYECLRFHFGIDFYSCDLIVVCSLCKESSMIQWSSLYDPIIIWHTLAIIYFAYDFHILCMFIESLGFVNLDITKMSKIEKFLLVKSEKSLLIKVGVLCVYPINKQLDVALKHILHTTIT